MIFVVDHKPKITDKEPSDKDIQILNKHGEMMSEIIKKYLSNESNS